MDCSSGIDRTGVHRQLSHVPVLLWLTVKADVVSWGSHLPDIMEMFLIGIYCLICEK